MSNHPDNCNDNLDYYPWNKESHECPECSEELKLFLVSKTLVVNCNNCGYRDVKENENV